MLALKISILVTFFQIEFFDIFLYVDMLVFLMDTIIAI